MEFYAAHRSHFMTHLPVKGFLDSIHFLAIDTRAAMILAECTAIKSVQSLVKISRVIQLSLIVDLMFENDSHQFK